MIGSCIRWPFLIFQVRSNCFVNCFQIEYDIHFLIDCLTKASAPKHAGEVFAANESKAAKSVWVAKLQAFNAAAKAAPTTLPKPEDQGQGQGAEVKKPEAGGQPEPKAPPTEPKAPPTVAPMPATPAKSGAESSTPKAAAPKVRDAKTVAIPK